MRHLKRHGMTALAIMFTLPAALAIACGSFSGADQAGADGGNASGDAGESKSGDAGESTSDAPGSDARAASPPSACDQDAAGTVYCDSFEATNGGYAGCGDAWGTAKGTGVPVQGGAHGGNWFCRFCGMDTTLGIDRAFAFTGHQAYVVTGWVRATPDAGLTNGVASELDGDDDAGQLFQSGSAVPMTLTNQWVPITSDLNGASTVARERAYFYPTGDAAALNCFDVDDIVLIAQ
jgi:hypothetical protein